MHLHSKYIVLFCLTVLGAGAFGAETVEAETQKERPRLYRGPYNQAVFDNYYYGLSPLGYRGFYMPYFSPLMYSGPIMPGRSSVTFAVGSDGYMGTAFSTAEQIKGTNIIYALSASWEQGEDYFYRGDYQLTTISPSLSWANENTSIFLGFEMSELSLENRPDSQKLRPRVDTSLVRNNKPPSRVSNSKFDYQSIYAGLNQRIGDRTNLYISVGEDFYGKNDLGLGVSHRLWDSSSRSRR